MAVTSCYGISLSHNVPGNTWSMDWRVYQLIQNQHWDISPFCGMDMFKATMHEHTALARSVLRSNQECSFLNELCSKLSDEIYIHGHNSIIVVSTTIAFVMPTNYSSSLPALWHAMFVQYMYNILQMNRTRI